MIEPRGITALLGPTNTGKTHRAVERMLECRTGMIGLPLRLLARELYDRVTSKVGEQRVALVTGEEKRVPKNPDYWLCTVEAMPLDVEVEFLAVDEIQLAAHPQRGHVFTDRLLHARGARETWFLGSDTMSEVLPEVVPTARIAAHPRLSRLSFAGSSTLRRLPPRSALVAFSLREVYELAERMRIAKGGAAVVLGALSPRARNAQVAMFQAGEVDFLVATDAIGMGLNLDVHHVAFAGLRKFDGREVRDLEAAEAGQIAGRAGRYVRDGTFGAVEPFLFPMGVAAAIEAQSFPPLRKLRFRSSDFDFSSIAALRASLDVRPRVPALRIVQDAEDVRALEQLADRPEISARASHPARVELLWNLCSVPDFEKLLFEKHVELLALLYIALTDRDAALSSDFVSAHVAPLEDFTGDVDTLVARIASVRTWTYISQKAGWVEEASEWQQRTRHLEDRLSDALHEQLVQRFVETKGKVVRKTPGGNRAPSRDTRTRDVSPAHPFAQLAKLKPIIAASPPEIDASAEALSNAPHSAFSIGTRGEVQFAGTTIAQLVRGPSLLLPNVRMRMDELAPGERARVERRILAFARDLTDELLGPVRRAGPLESNIARGLVYAVEQSLGTIPVSSVSLELPPADREQLEAAGVVLGTAFVHLRTIAETRAQRIKLALLVAHEGADRVPDEKVLAASSFSTKRGIDERVYLALGYPIVGRRAIRVDWVEAALATELPSATSIATELRCDARTATAIRSELERLKENAPGIALGGALRDLRR